METRIRRNIIILVVLTFLILVGMSAGWFFVLVRPQKETIAKVDKEYGELKGKAALLKGAQESERKAQDKLEYLEGQLNFFRGSAKTDRIGGLYRRLYFGEIDGDKEVNIAARQAAWRKWMNEYHYAFGPALQSELRRAEALANVKLTMPAIKVDDPPQRPEDVKPPASGFMKPLGATGGGQVTLVVSSPSFGNILRFLEVLNHSSILMVAGNIKLERIEAPVPAPAPATTSAPTPATTPVGPQLQATFPITPYLLAAGPAIKPAPAPAPTPTPNPDGSEPTPTPTPAANGTA